MWDAADGMRGGEVTVSMPEAGAAVDCCES